MSIHGIEAHDLISRKAMLEGSLQMENGDYVLSFVRNFYGRRLTFVWERRGRGKEESRGRLDAVVVQFGTTRGTRGHPSQGAGEQWEWEMSTRSRRKSLGRMPGSGCLKARRRCGIVEVPFPPGRTH